ncbi:RNA polymerase sigma factor [Paenibacillus camerounensis]|uniref:RNA polymerase sigma factor n=1 Tax=Paenibacillus camerounensis TaxID=1243663 RepID=UPI0005A9722A|nr:sigma-70 family RNA polymerase sigma factor [Paenibacillus camerounensis]
MTEPVEDRLIIERVLGGDREAFAVLIDKYSPRLYFFLLEMGSSPQDAQDQAQEAFIQAYRKLRSHRLQSSFSAWLYAIAVNVFREAGRRKRFSFANDLLNVQIDSSPTPEERYMRRESEVELQRLIQKLPQRYRIVLLLYYTEDLSYEEISAVTGLTLHQVKNRLYQARRKLKKLWPGKIMKEDAYGQTKSYEC